MYIPIMKNRLYENKLCRDYKNLFCDEIVPMMEIIVLKIGRTPKSIFEVIENYMGASITANTLKELESL